mmetsp:Transcript_32562/g.73191  ORF Transcript_32562/g.73191 Transcript_32562/m.73191 type:complete len:237 (-) Transcript_32562:565-1275(-)
MHSAAKPPRFWIGNLIAGCQCFGGREEHPSAGYCLRGRLAMAVQELQAVAAPAVVEHSAFGVAAGTVADVERVAAVDTADVVLAFGFDDGRESRLATAVKIVEMPAEEFGASTLAERASVAAVRRAVPASFVTALLEPSFHVGIDGPDVEAKAGHGRWPSWHAGYAVPPDLVRDTGRAHLAASMPETVVLPLAVASAGEPMDSVEGLAFEQLVAVACTVPEKHCASSAAAAAAAVA